MSLFHRLRPLHRLYPLLPARRRTSTDCVRGTTCVHIGSIAPDKKSKCFSFKIQLFIYFRHTRILGGCAITLLQQIHPNTGGCTITSYHKYTRLLGEFIFFGSGFIFFGSVDISSSAQWNYFLWLSGFIFSGLLDLSSSDSSSMVIIGFL
jgi:hypothetical protein